jgi:hypothetical protein
MDPPRYGSRTMTDVQKQELIDRQATVVPALFRKLAAVHAQYGNVASAAEAKRAAEKAERIAAAKA